MEYFIQTCRGTLPVEVTEKAVKNVRLRVFPSQEIRLTVPIQTSEEFINSFLRTKTAWINRHLIQFKDTEAIEKEDSIRTGMSTRILGRQLVIKVAASPQKRIVRDDLTLWVNTPNPQDQNDIDRQFNNWWQKKSKEYFQEQINRLFPIIEKHGIRMPNLVVRKMQTLWGSCSRRNHTVNLNYYLYKAPVPCIEYVILHELAHFLYPRHDQNFHDFITIYMPDWQERKRLLDYEIVLGI